MATANHVIVMIKVDLIVNASDGLRRIVFGLEKDTADDGTIKWIIHFKLFERDSRSVDYTDPRITLDIEVDTKLNSKAETAAKTGLSVPQAAHLKGPAANAAIAADAGEIDADDATATIQRTLSK